LNVILGGTHGLGHEIAVQLQEKGEQTFVVGRSYDQAQHGLGMAVDASDPNEVHMLVEYLDQGIGETALKGFFCVAGYGYNGDFAEQPEPQQMANINFASIVPIAQSAWKKLLGSENGGNFVVISSTTGVRARKDEAVYAATKHAQVGFARSLGLESERLEAKIKVALFMPGGMHTPFWTGNEPANFDEFLDPAKVAERIITKVTGQQGNFYEETIERGSL